MTKPASERLGPLVARVRQQAAAFVARDGEVRAESPDAVHQMRVATRRLRSCLRTFRSAFEAVPAAHLSDELSWIADVLGAARDAQVIAERIAEEGPAAALLADGNGEEVRALEEAMASSRYQALIVEIATFAISPPLARDAKGRRWMVRRLKREIERVVAKLHEADALEGFARDDALHAARKIVKRVRYAAETLEPLYGKRARRIANAFEAVQIALGDHHDAIVLQARLQGRPEPEAAELLVREQERAERAEAAFGSAWAHVVDTLARRWPTA